MYAMALALGAEAEAVVTVVVVVVPMTFLLSRLEAVEAVEDPALRPVEEQLQPVQIQETVRLVLPLLAVPQ
jgi:hypothetical protein